MKTSKAIQLLALLTSEELKEFKKWLDSPWCNSNKTLSKLFGILRKYYPSFDLPQLTKENLFHKIYPDKAFSSSWMNNLLSELSKQINEFIIHQNLRKDQQQKDALLLKEYRQRNELDTFTKSSTHIIQCLETKKVKDWEDYYRLMILYKDLYFFPNQKLTRVLESREELLHKSVELLEQFYILGKFRFVKALEENARMFPFRNDVKRPMLNEQISVLKNINPAHFPVPEIEIYYEALILGSFNKVRELFFHHFEVINKEDQALIFFYIMNEHARLLRVGQSNLSQLLELYKLGLQNNLLLQNNTMTSSTFTNIVTISVQLHDFLFCEKFIVDYSALLNVRVQENAKIWAKAYIAFHRKDNNLMNFANKLSQTKFKEIAFAVRARVLAFQILIEEHLYGKEQNESYMIYMFDAFDKQLRRNTPVLPGKQTDAFLKFVRYAKKVIYLVSDPNINMEKKEKLIKAVHGEKLILAKSWLIDKIEEI